MKHSASLMQNLILYVCMPRVCVCVSLCDLRRTRVGDFRAGFPPSSDGYPSCFVSISHLQMSAVSIY